MKKMIPALAVVFGFAIAALVPTSSSASSDESRCGKCGDGYCNPRCGENATSCPTDCGGSES